MPEWIAYALGIIAFVMVIVVWGLLQATTTEAGTQSFSGCGNCDKDDDCKFDSCSSDKT